MKIEVAYATPEHQWLIAVDMPAGVTAMEAIQASSILLKCPDLNPDDLKLGVFSRRIQADTVLQEHDRVEIYRPLLIDPKEKRRQRAKKR